MELLELKTLAAPVLISVQLLYGETPIEEDLAPETLAVSGSQPRVMTGMPSPPVVTQTEMHR